MGATPQGHIFGGHHLNTPTTWRRDEPPHANGAQDPKHVRHTLNAWQNQDTWGQRSEASTHQQRPNASSTPLATTTTLTQPMKGTSKQQNSKDPHKDKPRKAEHPIPEPHHKALNTTNI